MAWSLILPAKQLVVVVLFWGLFSMTRGVSITAAGPILSCAGAWFFRLRLPVFVLIMLAKALGIVSSRYGKTEQNLYPHGRQR